MTEARDAARTAVCEAERWRVVARDAEATRHEKLAAVNAMARTEAGARTLPLAARRELFPWYTLMVSVMNTAQGEVGSGGV